MFIQSHIFFKFIRGLRLINLSRVQSLTPSISFAGRRRAFRPSYALQKHASAPARGAQLRENYEGASTPPYSSTPSTRNWNRIERTAMSHWLPLIILIEQTQAGKQINGV